MLLRDRDAGEGVDQQAVGVLCGTPTATKALAGALGILAGASWPWFGGPVQMPGASAESLLCALSGTGSWIAMLWQPKSSIGHFVVVDAVDPNAHTLDIRDPWPPGTCYRMGVADFVNYWSGEAVFRR